MAERTGSLTPKKQTIRQPRSSNFLIKRGVGAAFKNSVTYMEVIAEKPAQREKYQFSECQDPRNANDRLIIIYLI